MSIFNIRKEVERRSNYIIRLRKHFHQYPELGMQEYETSKRIKEELDNMEIPYKSAAGTGIIGLIGQGERVIALRADMDALRVYEKTEVSYCSKNEGVMHACGHDAHMAALLGAAAVLKEHEKELPYTVKLIFQPSEENCVGARLICEEGHLDDVEAIYGLHVFADIPCGKISIQPGPRMANTDNFIIDIEGTSGHAGKPQQCVDATVVGASLVMNVQTLISREMDPNHSAVVTIGKFNSGTQHNIISGKATLEGTVRTFDTEDSRQIEQSMRRMIQSTANVYNANAHLTYNRSLHPIVWNDPELTKVALQAAKNTFPENMFVELPKLFLGEDFASYQQHLPGVFAFVGAGNEALGRTFPNHHDRFNIDEKAVLIASSLYVAFALGKIDEIPLEK